MQNTTAATKTYRVTYWHRGGFLRSVTVSAANKKAAESAVKAEAGLVWSRLSSVSAV